MRQPSSNPRKFRAHHLLCIAVAAAFPATARAVTYTAANTIVLGSEDVFSDANNRATGIAGNQQVGLDLDDNQAAIWISSSPSAANLTPGGLLGSNAIAIALAIGDGQEVGGGTGSNTGDNQHALLWTGNAASAVDLNPTTLLGGNQSSSLAQGVAGGRQVGYGDGANTNSQDHALLWTGTAASAVDLNPTALLGSNGSSLAFAINDNQEVGYGQGPNFSFGHALLWTGTAASAVDLNPTALLGSQSESFAVAVGEGQQGGYGDGPNTQGFQHALLWTGSAASAVDLHPADLLGADSSSGVFGVNDGIQVGFGEGDNFGGESHALAWTGTASSVVDLSTFLPQGFNGNSDALAVDAYGDVAGWADDNNGIRRAVEWLAGNMYVGTSSASNWSNPAIWTSTPQNGHDVLIVPSDGAAHTVTLDIGSNSLHNVTLDETGGSPLNFVELSPEVSMDAINMTVGAVGSANYYLSGGFSGISGTLTLAARPGSQAGFFVGGEGAMQAGSIVVNSGGTLAIEPLIRANLGDPIGGSITLAGGVFNLNGGLIGNSTPIVINASSFNQDVVVERTASNFQTAVSTTFDGTYDFYENGYSGQTTSGLPQNHTVTSASNPAVSFTLQSYTANNVLLEPVGGSGTLTLATPGTFDEISFLATAANGTAVTNVSLNFSDGSSTLMNATVHDWFNSAPGALQVDGRIVLANGSIQTVAGFPRLFEFDLPLPELDFTKLLTSVTFDDVSGGVLGVFALSGNHGQLASAPQNYENDVNITQDSTISITGSPIAMLDNLNIASNTLHASGIATANLQFTSCNLSGNPIFDVTPGTTLQFNQITGAGNITKNNGGTLTLLGALNASGSLTINGGTVALSATSPSTITALSITPGATLDMTSNHMFIDYTGADPIATIRSYLISGFAGGTWNGPGIDSSSAAQNSAYAVGYADGADGVVTGLSSGQIEIKYTLYGDANLDGIVSGIDFTILVGNLGKSVNAWDKGDFNYDGVVSGTDFTLLVGNLGKSANGANIALSAADLAAIDAFASANGLMADVPEPASAGLITITATTLLTKRRRRFSR